ncbi:hypothetical protein [Mucilaginibacter aquaedulcis]|uniref:hypothetical protein n=1 Tax=Mucilaginibacter aquaedulcis TaxID=1187081 RepID=UPI0025B44F62|nr:hypothetical protein [Mucilaginibacter aquaedulcis]MDN3548949.1 hypothetical protein [Mucilaginibacter aquaedulcis]
MKALKFILLILALAFLNEANAQNSFTGNEYRVISYPGPTSRAGSLYVSPFDEVFLSLNGGIYNPKNSFWFIPPSKEYYFTSFAPILKDTAAFVFANTEKESQLFYIKNSFKSPIKPYLILSLPKGAYNIVSKNDICYVYGCANDTSKIGILIRNKVKWLMTIEGLIKQVQVDNDGKICFLYKNSIYELNDRKIILSDKQKLYGFAFDKNNQLIVSGEDGLGIKKNDTLSIIISGVKGIVSCGLNNIFILDQTHHNIIACKY